MSPSASLILTNGQFHTLDRDVARKSAIPVADEGAFWGVMGCSCFAF